MSETVIVLREESVLIAQGKGGSQPKLTEFQSVPIDGYGNLREQWENILRDYREENKPSPVTLVLPSGSSTVRVSQVPYASGKQFTGMAKQILEKDFKEDAADYAVIQSDRKRGISLCCGGTEPDDLTSLVDFCRENQIYLSRVTVPLEGYLRFLQTRKEFKEKTAVFLFFEESSVVSILYRRGVCHYSSRTIVFSEPGTLDFGTEIVRNISGIRQFYTGESRENPITDVYYAGCEVEDFEPAIEGIRELSLAVAPLSIRENFGLPKEQVFMEPGVVAPFFYSRKKNDNLNLLNNVDSGKEHKRSMGNVGKHILVPGVILLVCVLCSAGLAAYNAVISGQIEEDQSWILSESVQKEYNEALELEKESADLNRSLTQVSEMENNLATYPTLTAATIADITDAGGSDIKVRIGKLDENTGVLEFYAVSAKVIDIPDYVEKLEKTDLFSEVDYSGYTYDDEQYSLSLSCVLKGQEQEDSTQGGEQ